MGLDKIYGIKPEENTCSDLVPLEYFYQAIADIKRIQSLLDEGKYDVGRQPLLVYLDIYLMFAKKYPNMASETVGKLKRKSLKETFDSWWERNEHKIPKNIELGFDKVLTTYLMNYLQYKVGKKNKVANKRINLPERSIIRRTLSI